MSIFVWTAGIVFVLGLASSWFIVSLSHNMGNPHAGNELVPLLLANVVASVVIGLSVTGAWALIAGWS